MEKLNCRSLVSAYALFYHTEIWVSIEKSIFLYVILMFYVLHKNEVCFMVNITKIKTLAKAKGIKQSYICDRLGMKKCYLNDVERGRNTMSDDRILKIANILETSYEYLTDETDNPERVAKKIKVFGEVAGGLPISQIDNFDPSDADSWEEITTEMSKSGDYFALRIKGNSMNPEMREGDVVIVRYQSTVESGDIAIVAINGDTATCKKVKFVDDGLYLISYNPEYQPMFFSNREIASLPITFLGKVVEVRRTIR